MFELSFGPSFHRSHQAKGLDFQEASQDGRTAQGRGLFLSESHHWIEASSQGVPVIIASQNVPGDQGETKTLTRPKVRKPPMYKVVLLNDDFTPMDFVIQVLQKFFQKDIQQATQIMLEVHHKGAGVAGVYSYEIAETKAYQVNQFARKNEHPLKCAIEKA